VITLEFLLYYSSKFIDEVFKKWNTWLKTLSLSNLFNDLVGFGSNLKRISRHLLVMIEYALWESSTGGVSSEGLGETERFSDWKICFHLDEWGSGNWLFTDNDTSSLGKSLINWSNAIIWGLDLYQENWLLEFW